MPGPRSRPADRGRQEHPAIARMSRNHRKPEAAARSTSRTRWIIDGMNVIGSRPDRWWNDPDGAVRRLIEDLDRYGSQTGEEITVVFDRRPPDVSPGRHGSAIVAFASRQGHNAADHEIVRVVAEDLARESLTVVTSDARLGEQVGGALGLAVLATLSTTRTNGLLAAGTSPASALTTGYHLAFAIGAGLVLSGIIV